MAVKKSSFTSAAGWRIMGSLQPLAVSPRVAGTIYAFQEMSRDDAIFTIASGFLPRGRHAGRLFRIGDGRRLPTRGIASKRRAREAIAKPEEEKPDESKATSGREVLNRMIIAYRQASSYADAGAVHLVAEAGGQKIIDDTWNFSLTLVRPNKIRLQAYQAMLVCDGKKLYGSMENQPGQVLVRPAPRRITLNTLFADRVLAMGLTQGVAGADAASAAAAGRRADEGPAARRDRGARAVGARPDRRPRLLPGATQAAVRHGHLLDRSGELHPAARRFADRRTSASASATSSRSIASRWWPSSPARRSTARSTRRRLSSRCPRARRS